jgi:probable HAF family extracellular repeat protein
MSAPKFVLAAIILTISVAFAAAQTTASCSFSYFVPPAPYNVAFQANGINHYGTVVGQTGSTTVERAFVHTSGGTKLFSVPGSNYTALSKRNSAGTSVGFYLPSGSSRQAGLVLSPSFSFATLNHPSSYSTQLEGINKYNSIVGEYAAAAGSYLQGFKYSGGKFSSIHFPGSVETVPTAINDSGVIVGMYWIGNLENPPHGFRYQSGSYKTVDVGTSGTQPSDINNQGTIVIGPNILRSSSGTLKKVLVPGAFETFVYGINDLNQITGVANYNMGNNTFTWKAFVGHCQ